MAVGYHGCDDAKAQQLADGAFLPSTARWDWLGDGLYFWERAPARAWEWARDRHRSSDVRLAVVEAEVDLTHCMDLTDTLDADLLVDFGKLFERHCLDAGVEPPPNAYPRLSFDGSFIRWALTAIEGRLGRRIDVVRAAYAEGSPLCSIGSETTHLLSRSHVQLCVRSPEALRNVRIIPP